MPRNAYLSSLLGIKTMFIVNLTNKPKILFVAKHIATNAYFSIKQCQNVKGALELKK